MTPLQFGVDGGRAGAKGCRVLVLGIGGGGCNVVARMRAEWTDGPETVAVNTDVQALAACEVPRRIQIGKNLTNGLGTGGETAMGKLAAEDDADALREVIAEADVVFLVTCFGGGTGTGAAPVIARIAREEDALALCFATLPFDFEGEGRAKQAAAGLAALRTSADVVLALPNRHLTTLVDGQTSLVDAFRQVDAMVGVGIHSLWKLLSQTGIINLDFADLRNLVEHSGGICSFGYGEGQGSHRSDDALSSLLISPYLGGEAALARAGALLVNITGGSDLTLVDVQKTVSEIRAHASPDARVLVGAAIDPSWQGRIALCVLAAENWGEDHGAAEPPPKINVSTTASETSSGTRSGVKPEPGPARTVQVELDFDAAREKGRFRNVEPTLYGGQDLDIPAYIRRGIKLSFEK